MNISRIENAAAQGAQLRTGILCSFLILFLGFFGLQTASAQAPSIHWTDLDSFKVGYQLSTGATTLAAGEQFFINLYLETEDPTECLGATFDLTYSDKIAPESNPLSLPNLSWLGEDVDLESGELVNNGEYSITYGVQRLDQDPQYGSGWVLTADFKVGSLPVHRDLVMQTFGGNLIVEENIDMQMETQALPFSLGEDKLATRSLGREGEEIPQFATGFKVFPNPCTDWIKIEIENEFNIGLPKRLDVLTVQIFDLRGNLLLQSQPDQEGRIELHALPTGMFIVVIKEASGKSLHRSRLLKR